MGKAPDSLMMGTVILDFAVFIYTALFILSIWDTEFQCYFITEILRKNFVNSFLTHRMTLLSSIMAALLGWLAATLITIYTYNKRKRSEAQLFYDPYEVAPMAPCLAFVTAILFGLTVWIYGHLKTSVCSILMSIVVVFLLLGAYFLFRYFKGEKSKDSLSVSQENLHASADQAFVKSQA